VADGDPPESAGMPAPVAGTTAERHAPSVVARVGRESEPFEELGPPVEIPLEVLALPQRRPSPRELEETTRASSTAARRARLLHLQRRLRREQLHARKRERSEPWIPEALYGNRFLGRERYFP
jgi:hypothetical protein